MSTKIPNEIILALFPKIKILGYYIILVEYEIYLCLFIFIIWIKILDG